MSKVVCLDASFVVHCVVSQGPGATAVDLLEAWRIEGANLVAPTFMVWEVGSTLRKLVQRGELTTAVAAEALDSVLDLPVREAHGAGTLRGAWRIAERFDLPVLYDAAYLAVAEAEQAEFWTADEKLVRKLNGALPYVRLLGRDGASPHSTGADPA